VDASLSVCSICTVPLGNPFIARKELVKRAGRSAVNLRKLVRGTGYLMIGWIFCGIAFIPFQLGFLASMVWLIHWWVRYGRIGTADKKYEGARQKWRKALTAWIIILAFNAFIIGVVLLLIYFNPADQ
jgi:hypothetical protein